MACGYRCMALACGTGLQVNTLSRHQVPMWRCPHHPQTRYHSRTLCTWPQGLVSVWSWHKSKTQCAGTCFTSKTIHQISLKCGLVVNTKICLHISPVYFKWSSDRTYHLQNKTNHTKHDIKYSLWDLQCLFKTFSNILSAWYSMSQQWTCICNNCCSPSYLVLQVHGEARRAGPAARWRWGHANRHLDRGP
jgi:hypothetical protein